MPKPHRVPFVASTDAYLGSGDMAPQGEKDLPNSGADKHDTPIINDVESLRKGIIKTSQNKGKAPYTILLVGEIGVGKSSLLELIANVIVGNDIGHYDFNILDHTNEQGGSNYQSQTNSARIYKLTSKNGIVVRIIDTPGVSDPRRSQPDERHMESIKSQINEHLDSITAVLVLVNGTVPGVTLGTSHAVSTIFATLPEALANHIAVVLTNVSGPLYQNFAEKIIPEALRGAPLFLLNNPVALQKKYLALRDVPDVKKRGAALCAAMEDDERHAMAMGVGLFDWLDGLSPYDGPQKRMDQAAARKAKKPPGFALLASSARMLSSLGIGRESDARA